jgi:protein Mpv17
MAHPHKGYAPLELERDQPRSASSVEADRYGLQRRASSLDASENLRGGVQISDSDFPEKKGRNLWDRYQRSLEIQPLKTKCLTSGVIALLGDIMGQYLTRSSLAPFALDYKRLTIYTITGLTFGPVVVHYWFNFLQRVGDRLQIKNRYGNALALLAIDQTVGSVAINAGFFVFFMLLKSAWEGNALDFAGTASSVSQKLSNEMVPTLHANWKVWPFANFVNFAFVPPHLRVLFSNFIAVGWSVFLSNAASK